MSDPQRLMPTAEDQDDAAAMALLAQLPTASLVSTVLDREEQWWRRRACVRALAEHPLAEGNALDIIGVATDTGTAAEVRIATLKLLGNRPGKHCEPLLMWLRGQKSPEGYGVYESVLCTRAALHDIDAAPLLVELAADDWTHRQLPAEEAIDRLLESCGLGAFLAQFGATSIDSLMRAGPTPAARLLGVRLVDRDGRDTTPALSDTSTTVARASYDLLTQSDSPADRLVDMVDARTSGSLWALAVLAARDVDIREQWMELGQPTVDLPGVPTDIREAIVREYVPGQRLTDPRWLIEHALMSTSNVSNLRDSPSLAMAALTAAGLEPQDPMEVGDYENQGEGTYYVIKTSRSEVWVSTLGPYFRSFGDAVVLDIPGLLRIDDDLGDVVIEGLCVYFFGSREPLTVHDLLFYWQD